MEDTKCPVREFGVQSYIQKNQRPKKKRKEMEDVVEVDNVFNN